jgi:hypothetical protein
MASYMDIFEQVEAHAQEDLHLMQGRLAEATPVYEAVLALPKQPGDESTTQGASWNLAQLYRFTDQRAEARERFARLVAAPGDPVVGRSALFELVTLDEEIGAPEATAALLDRMIADGSGPQPAAGPPATRTLPLRRSCSPAPCGCVSSWPGGWRIRRPKSRPGESFPRRYAVAVGRVAADQ